MRLRLKENPREWQKFTAVTLLAIGAAAVMLRWRKLISTTVLVGALFIPAFLLILCLIKPHWFRGYYRGGMRFSFAIGQVMSRILLGIFFLLVLTTIALFARIMGKDLLKLKRNPTTTTYWQPAQLSDQFDREF
jgi:hypothetical protein